MIAEVPNTAQFGVSNKRKIISKHFRRLLEHHQGKAFNGPPENTRECVMAATTSLQEGDWAKSLVNIKRLKMWGLLSNSDTVMKTIVGKIQEVGLRTYLLTFAPQYASLSLATLVEMFQLPEKTVYRICCKMMVNEQLLGTDLYSFLLFFFLLLCSIRGCCVTSPDSPSSSSSSFLRHQEYWKKF